jgi:hypothetical protein
MDGNLGELARSTGLDTLDQESEDMVPGACRSGR